jgi:hypothetical protein
MVSNTSRKDYFDANALEITPHPNQMLRAVLGRPVMDPRLKYSVLEGNIVGTYLTSAVPTALISINQGTTDITRVGDRIKIKRLWLSGKIYGHASQTAPTATRVVVALWNPPAVAGNLPVASQVIQASTGYLPFGAYSRDFGDSFQIVYDAMFCVNQLASSADAELFHIDRQVNIDVEFNAAGTAPVTNGLFMWLHSDTNAAQPSANFQSTLWFEDVDA